MILTTNKHVPVTHLAREAQTLAGMFRLRAQAHADRPAYLEKKAGSWQPILWRQFYDEATRVAVGLRGMGIQPGDRVAILGRTGGRWAILEMGAQLAGAISIGIYPHQSIEQLEHLLTHSDTRVVFVDDREELGHIVEACAAGNEVKAVVPWPEMTDVPEDPLVHPFADFAKPLDGDPLSEPWEDVRNGEDTAIFIYTSGTTGPPKAARISHANILALLGQQDNLIDLFEDDLSLSFLPMAHAAERVMAFYGRISTGIPTCYASSIAVVLDEVAEVRPTFFGSVPRIFEKAYSRIHSEIENKPAVVRALFAWASRVGRAKVVYEQRGKKIPLTLAWQHRIADRLVFVKIRAAFGGRVRQFITGAAPIARDILTFFWGAGLPIYEVYGMTEATVITHANRPDALRLGSVGKPIPPMEQKIAGDGEILLRGPWVFQGYFKNDEATAETVIDGWLHTGDIGRIDEDGYLFITDRKKHMIITAGGKNLSPANIENAIKNEDALISQVHAHGDRRPYVSALIAPSPLETLDFGRSAGVVTDEECKVLAATLMKDPTARTPTLNQAMAKVAALPKFRQRIVAAVARGNRKLAQVEKVKRIYILDRDFSQEAGELTPTMKLKRKSVENTYQEILDKIYSDEGVAVKIDG